MLAIGIAGCLLLIILSAFITYRITFYSSTRRQENVYDIPNTPQYEPARKRMTELIKDLDERPYELVMTTSFDRIKLVGKYYHVSDDAPLQIQFHGYRGSGIRDFCGGNKLAREMGFNTLIVCQRGHGRSEGNTITFGIKERYDCLCWIDYACKRFGPDKPIVLAGVSMGASTVLMALGLNLPKNVIGVIADSPFTSPESIIRKVCRDRKLPPEIVYPFIRFGASLFGHFNLVKASAEEAVAKASIPVLLLHGQEDRFVPCEMSEEIYAACASTKRLELFPRAGHGLSYIVDSERYERATKEFVKLCFDRYAEHPDKEND